MPRKAINYKKVIIYKLVCNDLSIKDLYVGHTTDFTNRKRCHKSNCLNVNYKGYNYKVYKMIREKGGWYNWSMIAIEKYPCNDDLEARARERHWYEVLNANMNTRCPTLNLQQNEQYKKVYYDQNKDQIKESRKEYYVQNKDKINEKHKVYREQIKTKKHLKYIQENESN